MNNMTGISNSLTGFSNNLSKNNGVINRTLSNLETTSQNFSKLQLEQTVTKLNTTIGSLQSTLNKVNNGKGSMALLTNDAQLYNNIKNTSATLNNLLYDLSARPHRYVNLSLFGGRKKKASPPLNAPNGD
jgi:phospholipid/cholesterol/gamma-HCH transport system substrate-binding protein